ncbi:MAG: acyclic terpene utilization AtuA family protein, partial [Candidatus Puniceispirillaceae bacterium]
PDLDIEIVEQTTNIVALAGIEQIQAALASGADIIIAGRATDTAIIAALPIARGCHKGAAWHGAKIAECGALATTNPNSGVILMRFDETGFTITPLAKDTAATPYTVSAHMLYENADPYILHEPGGWLDVREAHYTALDDVSVRVEGSIWHDTTPYTVKLEAARRAGYQTVSFVLVRDAHYREHIEDWVAALTASFQKKAARNGLSDTKLELRVIGRNATLGSLENRGAYENWGARENREVSAGEVGVMAIFTSPTQQQANEAAKLLNPDLLHLPLTPHEPMPTFAFPFSPPEMNRGASYEFCLHHIMAIDDPLCIFRLDIIES